MKTPIEEIMMEYGWDWYAVTYQDDPDPVAVHHTGLSSILQCGHDPRKYGIIDMRQCGLDDD
jgi:hypothetical protein